MSHKIVSCQETVTNNIEALCISLKRLFYPCHLSDLVKFLEETVQKFVIFNYILDYIYSRFNHLLSSWNQDISQVNKLALYCNVIPLQESSPLQNYFGGRWWNSFPNFSPKDKSKHCLQLAVTSEYTVLSFKVRLYLMDSLVSLVAPIWEKGMIVSCSWVRAAHKFTEISMT